MTTTELIIILLASLIVGFISKSYITIFKFASESMKPIMKSNRSLLYILSPLFLFLSSQSLHFKHASGSLSSYLNTLLARVTKQESIDQDIYPMSIPVVAISSILAVMAGSGIGFEMPAIYVGICSMMALSTFFTNIPADTLFYYSYAFLFTVLFGSPLSSISLVIEKALPHHPEHLLQYIGVAMVGSILALLFSDEPENPYHVPKSNFNYQSLSLKSIGLYGGFAVLCGIASSLFIEILNTTFDSVYQLGPMVAILCGIGIAFIVNITKINPIGFDTLFSALSRAGTSIREFIGYILNIILTISSGASGGLFMPSINLGGSIGSLFSSLIGMPSLPFIIFGMAAFLGAMFHIPITSSILINLLCSQSYIMLPMMCILSVLSSFSHNRFNQFMKSFK
jgi:CIC family chloride channel protein